MPVHSFRIRDRKAIRLAECANVPPLMLIAGPNGVGKSTLLFAIRNRDGEVSASGTILYVPPHRAWRRQTIRYQTLWGVNRTFAETLSGDSVAHVEGLRILEQGSPRTPDSTDEALALVKYSLAQIETRRQAAITSVIDQNNLAYPVGSVPDIYQPLRQLTRNLLPHLVFSRVDASSRDNVRCLFSRAQGQDVSAEGSTEIDIDELSSGEKAIVSLCLPFVERQIAQLLAPLERPTETPEVQKLDLMVLIDEPELHLHPALQVGLLAYLRELAAQGGVQFIMATHSSALLDSATAEELYILTPDAQTSEPTNQLIQLASSPDRLDAIRALCGDTYPATACRRIVCIEGNLPSDRLATAPDLRILEMLHQDFSGFVVLPLGGRSTVLEGTRRLRDILPAEIPGLDVFAVVDRDQSQLEEGCPDWLLQLPACMIENLLLVPSAISAFLTPYREKLKLDVAESGIEQVLREIAATFREDEVRLRVQRSLTPVREFLSGSSVEEVKIKHAALVKKVTASLPDEKTLEEIVKEATTEVDAILREKKELTAFRGKEILQRFHSQHLGILNLPFSTLCIELARQVSAEDNESLAVLVSHLRSFVPGELAEVLYQTAEGAASLKLSMAPKVREDADTLARLANAAVEERRQLKPLSAATGDLQDRVLDLAKRVRQVAANELGAIDEVALPLGKLERLARQIGRG